VKPGGSRLAAWFFLAALLCAAAGGFVFLAGLAGPGPADLLGYSLTGDSAKGESRDRSEYVFGDRTPTLEIPVIGVDTSVVALNKKPDGTLETPSNYDEAGWWVGGPMPGDHGAAVVTGHVDSEKTGPAVFYRLAELAPGDAVRFTTPAGKLRRFKVERTERYAKNSFPTKLIYGRTNGPELRLVTCTGTFDAGTGNYRDNLVVYARPV
jgi:sortase (surface protein transpeptidase)